MLPTIRCLICLVVIYCTVEAAPSKLPLDQIIAIFPAEVYHLKVKTTEEQRTLIQKVLDDHPNQESTQWAIITSKEPQLASIAKSLWDFLQEKEQKLTPPGRLLFQKLIDGIPIVRFGDPVETKKYVYETLRLWYSMDLRSKQNFAKILPRNAAALSNPNLVHYALAETVKS